MMTRSFGGRTRWASLVGLALLGMAGFGLGADEHSVREEAPKPAPVPEYRPAKQPVVTGEFTVGVITITFKETAVAGDLGKAWQGLDKVTETHGDADPGAGVKRDSSSGSAVGQAEYFKIYSNGIAWPKIVALPDEVSVYQDPYYYGYYCEYDYWENPIGWKTREEGDERAKKMNQNALRFATKSFRGQAPKFLCYNYVTTRQAAPASEVTDTLRRYYTDRTADPEKTRPTRTRRNNKRDPQPTEQLDPWDYYAPACKWGDPLWPNSKVQINDFAGGVLAHELGHCLGAPDVYRLGRYNDGISGESSLLPYGPTANAFSRFYHHAYIQERNHPVIKSSGTYTLHPRHITPQGDEAVGFLIPTNHPHYFYHVEYIYRENDSVGVGSSVEGMLIAAVNLGRTNYLGSPDYYYVYRPNDPFFTGRGDTRQCLFGKAHNRTEFSMTSEPSARLPNLLDGGVTIKNIAEHAGTLTFDVVIDRKPVTGNEYVQSMLPQIRLDEITDVQPTSFTMDCTIKFRGEPLITHYGFCWSTSRNPTVRDANYTLAHRECFRGHALNLRPGTTYYVRAFATNGLGVRYSDEEKTVTTPATSPQAIGPLLTDSFSNNEYLFAKYSYEPAESSETFISYSPTCVLAKLIGYYRPQRFAVGPKNETLDFNEMNWNPGVDDPPKRRRVVEAFFQTLYSQGHQLGMQEPKPGRDFLNNLSKITGMRSRPVMTTLSAATRATVLETIRKELAESRPVPVLFAYDSAVTKEPPRWAIIDGINAKGEVHVDFPRNSKLVLNGELRDVRTGFRPVDELIVQFYTTHIVTSCVAGK